MASPTAAPATLRRNFFDALVFLSLIPPGEMMESLKDWPSRPTFPHC